MGQTGGEEIHCISTKKQQTTLLDGKATYGYFLEQGIASVVVTVANGGTVEVGVIGIDGIVGLPYSARHRRVAGKDIHSDRGLGLPYQGGDVERRIRASRTAWLRCFPR